jgi:hypothetical protein
MTEYWLTVAKKYIGLWSNIGRHIRVLNFLIERIRWDACARTITRLAEIVSRAEQGASLQLNA